jgi:UDP-N-acetylglucosamine acyltransferase
VDILPLKKTANPTSEVDTSNGSGKAPKISPMSIVAPTAQLGEGVEIGPFCVVGPDVKIGARTKLLNNVTVIGNTTIGTDNVIWSGSCIGGEPQDISYRGTATQTLVGDRNTIRENVTINRASEKEEGITSLGSDCFLMGSVHIGHDCFVGDRVILGQGTMLGGHSHIHSYATLSGMVAVTHFASIGSYCFIGGCSRVLQDIPPYMLADGNPARCKCTNVVSLKRNGFAKETIVAINEAFRLLFRGRVGADNAREVLRSKELLLPEIENMLSFLACSRNGQHGRGRHHPKPVVAAA